MRKVERREGACGGWWDAGAVTRVRVRGGEAAFDSLYPTFFREKRRLQPLILAGMFNEILQKRYVFA